MLGTVIQFLAIRFYLESMGEAGWGACLFLLALGKFASLIDLAIPDGTSRHLTSAHSSGDEARMARIWGTHVRVAISASVFAILAYAILGTFIAFKDYPTPNPLPIFIAAGFAYVGQYLVLIFGHWFSAQSRFGPVAVSLAINSVVGAASCIGLTALFRHPSGYLSGLAIGGFAASFYLANLRRKERLPDEEFDRGEFKLGLNFGLRAMGNRIAAVFGNAADRVAIKGTLGEIEGQRYGNAARVSEAAYEILPIAQIIGPDLIRSKELGQTAFDEAADRTTRTALGIGISLIAVPCAFAPAFLPIWLGPSFVSSMPLIMVLIGGYRMFELYFSTIGQIMYASGRPERAIPFTIYNGLVTGLASVPVAKTFGILGIAVMNLCIHLGQFLPLVATTFRTLAPGVNLRRYLGQVAAMLLIGAACCFAAYFGSAKLQNLGHGWWALLCAPFGSALSGLLVFGSGLAPMPSALKKIIGR